MQDPFADKSNNRFHREVQMWMTVLMCLLVTFLYLVVKRVGGSDNEIPAHILQADVTHYERALVSPPKPSQLSSAPPIRSGSFATNVNPAPKPIAKSNLIAKSNFGFANQPNPSERLPSVAPQPATAANLKNASLPFPKPTFIKQKTTPSIGPAAEAIGRERARQLAALTNGLPDRLNQIQSSVKRATAELAPEAVAANSNPSAVADNAFVRKSPLKPVVRSPLKPIIKPPKKFLNADLVKAAKPIPVQPAIKSSFVSEPLVASSPALAPIPSPTVSGLPRVPVKESPKESNAFVPLPSLRPITAPAVPKVAVEPPRLSMPAEPISKPVEIEKPVKPIPDPSPKLKRHVVQTGESFFTIAQQHYGDAQWFRALRLANHSVAGGELPVGVSLVIPTTAELTRQFPEYALRTAVQQPTEAEQRIYVTQAGDTLFDIARRKTGQGSRFSEIIGSNELRLPPQIRASDQLPEGLHLVLPESSLQ